MSYFLGNSPLDFWVRDQEEKRALESMQAAEDKDRPALDNVEWARQVVANKAAFLNHAVRGRKYLKNQPVTLSLVGETVTLSFCWKDRDFQIRGPRGLVICPTIDMAVNTFVQDLARTVPA